MYTVKYLLVKVRTQHSYPVPRHWFPSTKCGEPHSLLQFLFHTRGVLSSTPRVVMQPQNIGKFTRKAKYLRTLRMALYELRVCTNSKKLRFEYFEKYTNLVAFEILGNPFELH